MNSLPNWPRLMTSELAAKYVGWSKNGFLGRVGEDWPEPIRIGGKVLWDRKGLDFAVDLLTGGALGGCGPGNPLGDPFDKAILEGEDGQS